jgi:flagellar biosynthesis/type III secretory pathway chaperone
MKTELASAADRLAAILTRENAALASLDYGSVGMFIDEKRLALEALGASARDRAGLPLETQSSADLALAERLRTLAATNKHLLEQAMSVQNRIMAVLAEAARHAQIPETYGARGRQSGGGPTGAFALVVRA